MITADIPDFGRLELHHLVTDYNGTLALDGILHAGVPARLKELARDLTIHVITADTFGLASKQLEGLPVRLTVIPAENQAFTKLKYVEELGAKSVVAFGNGRNDRRMFGAVALSVALLQEEGLARVALLEADLVSPSIQDALDLLVNPERIKATLRS